MKSEAYKAYIHITTRVHWIDSYAQKGIVDGKKQVESIQRKLGFVKESKPYKLRIKGGGEVDITSKELSTLNYIAKNKKKELAVLPYYMYSILLVYQWGAFETYVSDMLKEIYVLRPECLKSEECVTKKDLVENLSSPIDFLVSLELEKLRYFSFTDIVVYLTKKFNCKLKPKSVDDMNLLYKIRNIVAHNVGKVNKGDKLPSEIKIVNGEIIINKKYYDKAVNRIGKFVLFLEENLFSKY